MKRNNVNETPERTVVKVLRTPVNPKPPLWSPILHATTPDLTHDSECKGTPALIRSLGINPDLDTSWSSIMATPTSTESPLLGIKKLDILENPNGKSKPIQRRHLFPIAQTGEEEYFNSEVLAKNENETYKVMPSGQPNPQILTSDILSFLKKPPSRFIYPEPIYISNQGTKTILFKPPNNMKHQSSKVNLDEHFSSSSVTQRCKRNSMEIKTIDLQKNCILNNSLESASSSSISEETDSQPTISQETKEDTSYKAFIPTNFLDENRMHHKVSSGQDFVDSSTPSNNLVKSKNSSIAMDQKECEMGVRCSVSESVGFSSASGEQVAYLTLNKAVPLLEEFNETSSVNITSDENCIEAEMEEMWYDDSKLHGPSSALGYPQAVGFSTASGKKLAISKEAIRRAMNIFNESEGESLSHPVVPNGKKVIDSEEGIGRTQSLQEDIHDKITADQYETSKSRFVSTVVNKGGNVFKSTTTGFKSPCQPSNKTEHIPPMKMQFAGFSTASGKNVAISEGAIVRAKALFDAVDLENSQDGPSDIHLTTSAVSSNAMKPEPVSKTNASKASNISHSVKENYTVPVKVPQIVGFNTASGKNINISELALSRAQNRFEEMSIEEFQETIEIQKPPLSEKPNCRSPPRVLEKDENVNKQRKIEEFDEHIDDDCWVSSPTIGKKKKKNVIPSPRIAMAMTPNSGSLSTFDDAETFVPVQVLAMRRKARQEQKLLIQSKQKKIIKTTSPKAGYLYQLKKDGTLSKKTWRELIGDTSLPEISAPIVLVQNYGMLTSVCLVEASNASSFSFFAWEHFPIEECRKNYKGIELGEFVVILSDDNTIGCEEIEASLLASRNVDPTLVSSDWIRNHYRWIVWKLASMEQRIPALFARTCLTPKNVLEQLKYRYDREIDNCQRSALKRIIEQDDTPAKTMILCVAEIRTPNVLELTDGWYSIEAHCDQALMQLVEKKKIFVGVKLAISGAELNSPGPTSPLEKDSSTYLKISANSTRRARWDSKLGFYSTPLPFPIKLTSVLADGGIVSHVRVNVIRVYPMVYMEKTTDGKTIFRGERQYRRISENAAMQYERMMEKLVEEIEREEDEQDRKRTKADSGRRNISSNLTDEEKRNRVHAEVQKRMQANIKSMEGVPMLKLRVIDWRATDSISAIVSIWRPNEELQHILKEGRAYHLYNVNAAGIRVGELQFNAMKHTSWHEIKNYRPTSLQLERRVTSFFTANQNGFKPIFNELDVVGLVVYVAQQQIKGPFQTVVLSDGTNYFGVKCWSSLEEYALADVIVVGAFLAFSNLQWRATASRTVSKIPFAFIHEGTLVSARPAQNYMDVALQDLKQSLKDPAGCVAEADVQISTLLGSSTPQSVTPKLASIEAKKSAGLFTPTGIPSGNGKKDDTPTTSSLPMNRARLLEKYGAPPALSPWNTNASPHVRQKFKPPARKPSM